MLKLDGHLKHWARKPPCTMFLPQRVLFFLREYYNRTWCRLGFLSSFFFFFLLFFWRFSGHAACGILVPPPGIKSTFPALEGQSPNLWTTRKVLRNLTSDLSFSGSGHPGVPLGTYLHVLLLRSGTAFPDPLICSLPKATSFTRLRSQLRHYTWVLPFSLLRAVRQAGVTRFTFVSSARGEFREGRDSICPVHN